MIIDTESEEFKTFLASVAFALKNMDTALTAYEQGTAALGNSEFHVVEPWFQSQVERLATDEFLIASSDRKYRSVLERWTEISHHPNPLEDLAAALRKSRVWT